jgi:hypothetical protein
VHPVREHHVERARSRWCPDSLPSALHRARGRAALARRGDVEPDARARRGTEAACTQAPPARQPSSEQHAMAQAGGASAVQRARPPPILSGRTRRGVPCSRARACILSHDAESFIESRPRPESRSSIEPHPSGRPPEGSALAHATRVRLINNSPRGPAVTRRRGARTSRRGAPRCTRPMLTLDDGDRLSTVPAAVAPRRLHRRRGDRP